MKKVIFVLLILIPALAMSQNRDSVEIYGKVSDYAGQPVDSADVILLSKGFQPVSHTVSDRAGKYSMLVPTGDYYAMAVVNMNHYKKSRLEYWAWNVPAREDIRIDARYDKMEVYALNAFRPQGAHPSYFLYFRPMSLTMVHGSMEELEKGEMPDIAPALDTSEITVEINRQKVEILSMQKVREYVGSSKGEDQTMNAYLIQVSLPDSTGGDYEHFRVFLNDRETGDRGEAVLYKKINPYIDK